MILFLPKTSTLTDKVASAKKSFLFICGFPLVICGIVLPLLVFHQQTEMPIKREMTLFKGLYT
jgi:hypothetical protein